MSAAGMLDAALEVTAVEPDEPVFTHLVMGRDGKDSATLVLEAHIYGTPVTALCGYVWVPSRDPDRHPLCSRCLELKWPSA